MNDAGASLLLTRLLIHVNDVIDEIHDYKMRDETQIYIYIYIYIERERERGRGWLSRIKWQTARSLEPLFPNQSLSLPPCQRVSFAPLQRGADPQALILWKWNIPSLISGSREKRREGKTRETQGHARRKREREREDLCVLPCLVKRVSAFSRQFFTREHALLTTWFLRGYTRRFANSPIENRSEYNWG